MLNKNLLVSVLLQGALVYTSLKLGARMQKIVDEVKFLEARDKFNNAIIETQQRIIEKLNSQKEES